MLKVRTRLIANLACLLFRMSCPSFFDYHCRVEMSEGYRGGTPITFVPLQLRVALVNTAIHGTKVGTNERAWVLNQ